MKNRYLYTLDEIMMTNIAGESPFDYNNTELMMSELINFLTLSHVIDSENEFDNSLKEKFSIVWSKYIAPRNWNNFIAHFTKLDIKKVTEYELDEDYTSWGIQLMRTIISSTEKYSPIVKNYNDNVLNLMKGLKTITTTKEDGTNTMKSENSSNSENFENDTPTTAPTTQVITLEFLTNYIKNAQSDNNSSNSSHLINGISTTERDDKSIIDKLADIRLKWENIYQLWSKDFDKLFIMNVESDLLFGDEEDE